MLLKERSTDNKTSLSQSLAQKYPGILLDSILVVAIAAFLRFYLIQTTEFDSDQAILFRMAYDAVHHGLLPVTSNIASIGIPHPPGVIYLYMIPALVSANPVGGAMLVSAFSTLAVLLTYFFTRRYFGRACALIAALLFAAAATPLNYSRFIWQPNLMSPFIVLYLFALFRGVYDRRPGWLMLALPLLGMLYQTHPTGALLGVLLVVALALAPGTVRWYDWAVSGVILAIIFFPYLLHLATSGRADLHTLLSLARQPSHIDKQAFMIYWNFIKPMGSAAPHPASLLTWLATSLPWLAWPAPVLVMAGALLVGRRIWGNGNGRRAQAEGQEEASGERLDWLNTLRRGWQAFRADPARCSMALLLLWQVVPLLVLSRHQVDLHAQYLFIFLPGPFILIALFLTWLADRAHWPGHKILAIGTSIFTVLLILVQMVGGTALMLDVSYGHYDDAAFHPYHNSLSFMQQALAETERVANEQHIQRIFIASDEATTEALHFLVPQMKHPVTLFQTPECFVLPSASTGPVVLLTNPYNPLADRLLQRFANAKLIATLPRQTGQPYKLYIVSTQTPSTPEQEAFQQQLALASPQGETIQSGQETWLVSRWQMQHTEQPAFRTDYSYALTVPGGGKSTCHMNTMQAGDQLLMGWRVTSSSPPTGPLAIQGDYKVTTPMFPTYGPLRFDQYQYQTQTKQLEPGAASGVTLSIT